MGGSWRNDKTQMWQCLEGERKELAVYNFYFLCINLTLILRNFAQQLLSDVITQWCHSFLLFFKRNRKIYLQHKWNFTKYIKQLQIFCKMKKFYIIRHPFEEFSLKNEEFWWRRERMAMKIFWCKEIFTIFSNFSNLSVLISLFSKFNWNFQVWWFFLPFKKLLIGKKFVHRSIKIFTFRFFVPRLV